MPADITQQILDTLKPFANTQHGQNRYNTPWRTGADGGTLAVDVDSAYGLNLKWFDHKDGSAGNGWTLAQALGLRVEGATEDSAPYASLKDYAHSHGTPVDAYRAAGWDEVRRFGYLAFSFPTANGTRYRYADPKAAGRKYDHQKGYSSCWYRLDEAIALAGSGPLILCNGEASTVAAQHHHLAACCVTGGERGSINAALLEQLHTAWRGPILVAFDCDTTGRRAGASLAAQLRTAGWDARAIDLKGGQGFDIADFCRLYNGSSVEQFGKLPALAGEPSLIDHATGEIIEHAAPPAQAVAAMRPPKAPMDVNDLLVMERKPTIWYAPGFLREGLGLLVGQPNVGKTPLAVQLGIAIATGAKWMNMIQCPQAKVLYLGVEYSAQELIPLFDVSRCGVTIPRDQLLVKSIEDDFPTTPEEAIAELEWYIRVMGVRVIIIDVLTAFLPPEKFKQNIYRGDYSELKPYHKLALEYNAAILGTWHASKREADPKIMYNGSTGMWAAAASRISMYQDQEQRVRIASFPRMSDKVEYALAQERSLTGHKWVVADASPEPLMSPTELTIYRCLKTNAEKARPIGPTTIAELTGISVGTVKSSLSRMFEKNIIHQSRVGAGYFVEVATLATSATLATPATDETVSTPERVANISASESPKQAGLQGLHGFTNNTELHPVWSKLPNWARTGLELYLASNIDSDQERAREICDEYGIDYDMARKEVHP